MSGIGIFVVGYITGVFHASCVFDEKPTVVFKSIPNQVKTTSTNVVKFCKDKATEIKEGFADLEEDTLERDLAAREHPRDSDNDVFEEESGGES